MALRLFCLPYSGASAMVYSRWRRKLPAWLQLRPVELPGRGARMAEPLHTDLAGLARQLARELHDEVRQGPYAVLGHSLGALLACDNTFATPVLQQPLALGADVVMHSTTKYFGGHSDVLGGALVFARRDALHEHVAHYRHVTGAIASPFSAWMLLRGCRSLPARMAWHCRNARAVAEFLASHPRVDRVNWPGLPTHPQHGIAAKQMRDFGGMLSVEIRGGRDAALAVAAKVKLFTNATSLGGCESLIEHRASVEGEHPLSPQNLLRISVGLEHPEDLVADLHQALD